MESKQLLDVCRDVLAQRGFTLKESTLSPSGLFSGKFERSDTKEGEPTNLATTSRPSSTSASTKKNKRSKSKSKSKPRKFEDPRTEANRHGLAANSNPRFVKQSDKLNYVLSGELGSWRFDFQAFGVTVGTTALGERYLTLDLRPAPLPPRDRCGWCDLSEQDLDKPFKWCSDCWARRYCGKACQAMDWKRHKKVCSGLAPCSPAEKDFAAARAFNRVLKARYASPWDDDRKHLSLHKKRREAFIGWAMRCEAEHNGFTRAADVAKALQDQIQQDGYVFKRICFDESCTCETCLANRPYLGAHEIAHEIMKTF